MTIDLQADMDTVFLDSGFEEDIVYTPSGGSAATISAIVDRGPPIQAGRARGVDSNPNRRHEVTIYVSTTDVPTVTPNEDTVQVKARVGDSMTRTMTVRSVISSDAGCQQLALGW